eukprot:12409964-Karenia_brevis.AAC.2
MSVSRQLKHILRVGSEVAQAPWCLWSRQRDERKRSSIDFHTARPQSKNLTQIVGVVAVCWQRQHRYQAISSMSRSSVA